jgi:hypothetical protein
MKSLALALLPLLALSCQRPRSQQAHPPGPELVSAGPGPVAEVVRGALSAAEHDGRRLVVYVSAVWCKPCERFQAAVRAGELDARFPRLRLLKFDQDHDEARLREAGYDGALIPRFVVPGPDGRGTAERMEGGTKQEDTVATSIGPRLQRLLEGQAGPSGPH